jgi:outer membrane protein assembly factor BamB
MREEVTRRQLLAAAGTAAVASALPRNALAQEQSGEWPAFGYDAAKTGYNPDGEGPTDSVGGAWQATSSTESIDAAPAVAGGTVYVASADGTLNALDAASGEAVDGWPVELENGTASPPTVADGTVYIGDDGGRLYAVDADSGEIQWRFGTDGAIKGSPTVVDGTVYIGSGDGFVYAVDAAGGEETEWEFGAGGGIRGGVAFEAATDGGTATVYAANTGGGVFAIDAATGDARWEEPYVAEGSIRSAPAVSDGVVYLGVGEGNEGSVRAVDAETGEENWEFEAGGTVFGSPAVAGDQVYAASRDRRVYGIDAATGEENWGFDTGRQLNNSPVVVGETVYAVSFDNTLYGLTTGGEERFAAETGGVVTVSPAVAGGRAYVGSENGAVYALESGGTVEFVDVGGDGTSEVEDSPLADRETGDFAFLALPATIAAVLAALSGGVYALYRSDLTDRFSVDEAPVESLYEDEEGIPDYDERTETEAWTLIVEDVMARADERTKSARENVIVTKHVDNALDAPITAYEVESARDERVRVTLTEPLDENAEALDEQPLNEGWSLGGDALTFETVLDPDERVRTMVGRPDAVDRAETLTDKPAFTVEPIDPPEAE